jgi:hypothetical protein
MALASTHLRGDGAAAADPPSSRYGERWVYGSANLQVDQSADDLIALIERASRAGYTGVVLTDYKFSILDRVIDKYFGNVERVRAAAVKDRIELIPALFPIGYSNGLLAHDPNLAEGLPVTDQPYIVKNRVAVLDSHPVTSLRNGNFEESRNDRFSGFSMQDDPGVTSFADRSTFHQGRFSCRLEPSSTSEKRSVTNTRLAQRVALRPHTAYRFSGWVKTRGLSGSYFQLLALGTSQAATKLTFHEGGLEPNQDWKRIEVVFNSLDQHEANVYVGVWGPCKGTLWVDDLALEELALVNVLRREGCPLTVKSTDGRTAFEEGRDFQAVVDAQLGQVPFAGEYEFGHPGATIRLTSSSRIKNGDRLRVSWYHPVITQGFQVMCCLSDLKLEVILKDQAKRLDALFHPRTFFMSHDEIRVANWCQACRSRNLSPGELLAENARRCTAILKSVNPEARVVVWSDMFDPHHNAVDKYYLVNGSLKGSWHGLAPATIIANWNSGKARESLEFFAGHGHKQIIAGYYDVDDLSNFQQWDAAARNVQGVVGFMYTTWQAKFTLLEKYGDAMQAARIPR